MNKPSLQVEVKLDIKDDEPVTAPEMKLLSDLLPELLKDLIWLKDDQGA